MSSKMFTLPGTGGQQANSQLQQNATGQQQQWIQQDRNQAQMYQPMFQNMLNQMSPVWGRAMTGLMGAQQRPASLGMPQFQSPGNNRINAYQPDTSGIPNVPGMPKLPQMQTTNWATMLPVTGHIGDGSAAPRVGSAPTLKQYQSTDWMKSLPNGPNLNYGVQDLSSYLPKIGSFDPNSRAALYSPDAKTLGQVNPTLDIEGTSRQAQSAYQATSLQSLADQFGQLNSDMTSNLARRGLTDSSLGQNAMTNLGIQRSQGEARNAADALMARLGVESGLRGEQSAGAMNAAGLQRQAALDAGSRDLENYGLAADNRNELTSQLGLRRQWQGEDSAGRNAVAQQGYQNQMERMLAAAGLMNQDVRTEADLASLQNQMNLANTGQQLQSWQAGNDLRNQGFQNELQRLSTLGGLQTQDTNTNANLAQLQNAMGLNNFNAGLAGWQAKTGAQQQGFENQMNADQTYRNNAMQDYQTQLGSYLAGLGMDQDQRTERRASDAQNLQSLLSQLGILQQVSDPTGLTGLMGNVAGQYGNIANQYGQQMQNSMAGLGGLSGLLGQLLGGRFGQNTNA